MATSEEARKIIDEAALRAAGIGVAGGIVPVLDVIGMAGLWVKLLKDLAEESGHAMDQIMAIKLVTSVLAGSGIYLAGCKMFTTVLNVTGVGLALTIPINAAFDWITTLRFGSFVAAQLAQPEIDFSLLRKACTGLASLVFALPNGDELFSALNTVSEALHLGTDVEQIARVVATVTDAAAQVGGRFPALATIGTAARVAVDAAKGMEEGANMLVMDGQGDFVEGAQALVFLTSSGPTPSPLPGSATGALDKAGVDHRSDPQSPAREMN